MKLIELAIEGHTRPQAQHLGRFADDLTLVYGENGAGKTTLRKTIRATLFDHIPSQRGDISATVGNLNVAFGRDEYRLSRNLLTQSALEVTPLSSASIHANSIHQSLANLNADLYDAVFNVSFQDTSINVSRLSSVLNKQLGVPRGPQAAGDNSGHLVWQRESNVRKERLAGIRARLDVLNRERSVLHSQFETSNSARQAQLVAIENQINQIIFRINEIQASNYQDRIVQLDREISQLRLMIENAQAVVTHVVPQVQGLDQHANLYKRLDEIDNQIRRWRDVQTDIQDQRVRLRDEMLIWNEMTLDSNEHPYHNARAILVALEAKVDEAERNANHWGDATASRVDTSQMARTLGELCQSMRDDLYGLCNELGQQYKHIRHKSAAAELKQLRRCYTEMGENIQRLIDRRESVIHDIRQIDPAGADAVVRSDLKFCECAQHAGYLEARKRYLGDVTAKPVYQTATTQNVDAELAQLRLLEQQRTDLITTLARQENELTQLNTQHAELVRQREAFLANVNLAETSPQIRLIDEEIVSLTAEMNLLIQRIDQDLTYVAPEPNALLKRAGDLLVRMSDGDLTQVFLSENYSADSFASSSVNANELQVRDRHGKVLNFSAIDTGLQDQVYLSSMLSAKQNLLAKGVECPTIIDDAFSQISMDRVTPTLNVLNDFARQGHQLIAMTQHRFLADRLPGVKVLELADRISHVTPAPVMQVPVVQTPIAQTPVPPTPAPVFERPATRFETTAPVQTTAPLPRPSEDYSHESYLNSATPRPYPLSKYPRTGSDYVSDDHDYTVAYPFNNTLQQHGPDYLEPHDVQELSPRSDVSNVSAVRVDSVGDRLGYAAGINENTRLDQVGFFESEQLRTFLNHGIENVSDLLDVEFDNGRVFGFHPDQMDRWQSQLWLLINLPGLRLDDARVLVAVGVNDPEQLDTSHPQQIFERIERFFATNEGRRFAGGSDSISLDRISGWYRSLDATRSRWQSGSRSRGRQSRAYSNRSNRDSSPRERREPRERTENRESRIRAPRTYQPREPQRESRQRSNRAPREPMIARAPRMNTPSPERKTVPRVVPVSKSGNTNSLVSESDSKAKRKSSSSTTKSSSTQKLKFYLDLSDHIEAAPSIGPKTAERFEKIGVQTVTDFLKQTAESMATKINYKRITADVIRERQHQARLVCRIPNLRGHDAQLLVKCGLTEPEELSTMQPHSLLEIIGPFSDTKEGMKIIRNGKKPDLAEVTDWITWAEQTRSIQAA